MQTDRTLPPAPRPCSYCPYRQDSPSGLWSETEYVKLPPYDLETPYQPMEAFGCHQQDRRLCAGWVAVHDMEESLALRVAVGVGNIHAEDLDAIFDYTTDVPVFASGEDACIHGMRDIEHPGREAKDAIRRLRRKLESEGKVLR